MAKKLTVKLPGQTEADAIAHDYGVAIQGSIAWVRIGLRLVDVKNRLAHGEFSKWIDANLARVTNLNIDHCHRAKRVADYLLTEHAITPEELLTVCEDEKHPLWQDVIGKSTRQLSLEVKNAQLSAKEEEAKAICEERWAIDLELRDEYEPRCLSGELSYVYALAGMTGAETATDKNGKKTATKHGVYLSQAAGSLKRHWTGFEKLESKARMSVISELCEALKEAPDVVKENIQRTLSN